MAARLEPALYAPTPDLVELGQLCAEDLDPLLDEEIQEWRQALDWDFQKSADLVRRFVDMRALHGAALVERGEVVGYVYYVLEDQKGLIGDLYVCRERRSQENEDRLLKRALDGLIRSSQIGRIESQLMMIDPVRERPLAESRFLSAHRRNFMLLNMDRTGELPERPCRSLFFTEKWSEHYQDAAAQLIADAYLGHVDGRINDQYRSVAGARRFLFNIVQYPGCGTFFRPASFVALDAETGRMSGLCLASIVAPECGHITQICVARRARSAGLGYALLRQSLAALREAGCHRTSLTVTSSNQEAVALYERVGFTTVRHFHAYVWEGF